ncbi:hypothetical protein HAX54_017641 [Datura stramonium]|uniref:Uncharacterized protein n=1 Tax=Datura stramonium TaxID=4076 RepID=A0ABS8UL96_DATST|nr:hypothetical protein [Datura stramonium]
MGVAYQETVPSNDLCSSDVAEPVSEVDPPSERHAGRRRSIRTSKQPIWMKDYVAKSKLSCHASQDPLSNCEILGNSYYFFQSGMLFAQNFSHCAENGLNCKIFQNGT